MIMIINNEFIYSKKNISTQTDPEKVFNSDSIRFFFFNRK